MAIQLTKPPKPPISFSKKPPVKPQPPPTPKLKFKGGVPFILVFYAALQSFRAAGPYPFSGPGYHPLAWAIADGTDDWLDSVVMSGLSTGQAGVGYIDSGTTQMFAIPAIPLMEASLTGAGVEGPLASSLAVVVTLAFVSAFTAVGGYWGVSTSVAIGRDYSKTVLADPFTLSEALMQSFASQNIKGPMAIRLANGLGGGIAALTLTAFGTGTVVGVPAPIPGPAVGVSFSVVS